MKSIPSVTVLLALVLGVLEMCCVADAAEQDKGSSQAPVPKLSTEPKPSAEPRLPPEIKPSAEQKSSVESKPSTDPKPSIDQKPSAESKQPAEPALKPPPASLVKPDGSSEKEAGKKPLGSLILTVKLALLSDPRLFLYDIEVDAEDHSISLAGRVARETDVAAAVEIARAVPGVQSVVPKLQVDPTLTATLIKKQDEHITTFIKERFARSATLKAANFDVKTENGIVSLSGSVRFQVIALEAAETARNVPGVRAVKTDQIRLEGDG